MLNSTKRALPLIAIATAIALGVSAVSIAAIQRFPVSNMGKLKGPVIMGAKGTPKRQPTHSGGTHRIVAMSIGQHLVGPAIRESGMGRLEGAMKQGAKGTPKRQPTLSVTPR
ncbi:MAG TPA: hypothetical protein VGL66_16780 [Caulobacteraceae bacterium]|jgi:hypothetical protein